MIFLIHVGDELSVVKTILMDDETLQEMATNPLMLNIITRAYQGLPKEAVSYLGPIEGRRKHLFNSYIKRMLSHDGETLNYSVSKTLKWLSLLASYQVRQSRTVFLIEELQPRWLASRLELLLYKTSVALVFSILYLIPLMLIRLVDSTPNGLFSGFLGSIVGVLTLIIYRSQSPVMELPGLKSVKKLIDTVYSSFNEKFPSQVAPGILALVAGGVIATTISIINPRSLETTNFILHTYSSSLFAGFMGAFIGVTVSYLTTGVDDIKCIEQLHWSTTSAVQTFLKASPLLIVGPIFAILIASQYDIATGVIMSGGTLFLLIGIILLIGGLVTKEIEETSYPNQGIIQSARSSFIAGLAGGFYFGLVIVTVVKLSGGDDLSAFYLGTATFIAGVVSLGNLYGGLTVIRHLILRILLQLKGDIPLNYKEFLDHTKNRLLVQKVGGGYIFIHRLLLDHLAKMTPEEIEQIS